MLLSALVAFIGPDASDHMAQSACIGPTATALTVRAATARMAFTGAIMAVRASTVDGGTPDLRESDWLRSLQKGGVRPFGRDLRMAKRNLGARRRHDNTTAEFRRARCSVVGLFTVVDHAHATVSGNLNSPWCT
jgi:hypothetical protein